MSDDHSAVSPQPCVRCGQPTPHCFGGTWVCADCYSILGAACCSLGDEPERKPSGPTGDQRRPDSADDDHA